MNKHLAIFNEDYIRLIFSGKKTIDVRFSCRRVLPFEKIKSGDLIYMKKSGKEIVGQFKAKRIIYYENLNLEMILKIKKDYNRYICGNKYFWNEKEEAKFGTLIFISEVQPVLFPLNFVKRDRRPWVILES